MIKFKENLSTELKKEVREYIRDGLGADDFSGFEDNFEENAYDYCNDIASEIVDEDEDGELYKEVLEYALEVFKKRTLGGLRLPKNNYYENNNTKNTRIIEKSFSLEDFYDEEEEKKDWSYSRYGAQGEKLRWKFFETVLEFIKGWDYKDEYKKYVVLPPATEQDVFDSIIVFLDDTGWYNLLRDLNLNTEPTWTSSEDPIFKSLGELLITIDPKKIVDRNAWKKKHEHAADNKINIGKNVYRIIYNK